MEPRRTTRNGHIHGENPAAEGIEQFGVEPRLQAPCLPSVMPSQPLDPDLDFQDGDHREVEIGRHTRSDPGAHAGICLALRFAELTDNVGVE